MLAQRELMDERQGIQIEGPKKNSKRAAFSWPKRVFIYLISFIGGLLFGLAGRYFLSILGK